MDLLFMAYVFALISSERFGKFVMIKQLILSIGLILISIVFLDNGLGFIIMASGLILNSVVILANHNTMPTRKLKFDKLYYGPVLPPEYSFIDEKTRYKLLSDYLYFPHAGGVFSIGDVLIYTGLITTLINHL
jgi:hypothetical protein